MIPKQEIKGEEPEDWLTTYADAITLLMAFFVMLLSVSKIDVAKYEQVAMGITKEIGGSAIVTTNQLIKLDLQDVIYSMQADQAVNVGTDDRGVVLELASSAFYKPGSADIRDEASPVLEGIGRTLLAPRYNGFLVEVEGHTDDEPISTARFPSNWELSAGRATRVVRFLAEQGMSTERLKATGYADTRPKLPNRDAEGTAIRENQAANRRVIIRLTPGAQSSTPGTGTPQPTRPPLIQEFHAPSGNVPSAPASRAS
jgi:chemotaxis protein MotB